MRRAPGPGGRRVEGRAQQDRQDAAQRQAERFTVGHKRRFVQDGEVPVTVVSSRRDGAGDATPHRGASVHRRPQPAGGGRERARARNQPAGSRPNARWPRRTRRSTICRPSWAMPNWRGPRRRTGCTGSRRRSRRCASELRACEERLHAAEAARAAAERSAHATPRTGCAPAAPHAGSGGCARTAEGMRAVSPRRGLRPGARRAKAADRKPAVRSKLVRWWIKEDAKSE